MANIKRVEVMHSEPKPHPSSLIFLVPIKDGKEGTEFSTSYRTWEKHYKANTAKPEGFADEATAKFKVKKKSVPKSVIKP